MCPLVSVAGLKRIEIYDDELTFNTPDSTIQHVSMSSEPHRNFFLIAMDGLVYKYDLVSKELLFQFHTNSRQIFLYDRDDKLVVVNDHEIRLWDFYDHKEEAPELISAMQLPSGEEDFKVERIFINKNSKSFDDPVHKENVKKNKKSESDPLLVLVTCKSKFVLYSGRLTEKFSGELEIENEHITSAAFSKDSSFVIMGTSQGKIFTYRISDGQVD